MLRLSTTLLLFSKPISQGYASQLPPQPRFKPGKAWMRAMDANEEVRDAYTPDADRYEQWYKETYGIEDLSDGCAASGATSNRLLSDERNTQMTATEYDLEGVHEELKFWSAEFRHNTFVK